MFEGFSPETFDFLWGIRMNNNRDWFLPHKEQYVRSLYEPMKALGKELFEPFLETPGNVLKVSRIYRDARMHPSEPYKESLWICIRKDVEWWAENPCLYFELCPEGASYGLIHWKPKVSMLADFRQDIAARPEQFLELISSTEAAAGIPVCAELYKRPKECDDPRRAPYFAWKGQIACCREEEPGENLFTPELAQRVSELFRALTPLYEYLNRFSV